MTLPLNTAPGPSPDAEAERNAAISQDLLRKARRELEQGDLLQASEKAWGAAAYAVKAVAEKRRWFSEADWKLRKATDIIAAEQGDDDVVAYYLAARDAHFNFYHHEYDAAAVKRAIDLTARLLDKMGMALAQAGAPPYVNADVEAAIRILEQPTGDPDYQRLATGRPPMSQRPPAITPEPPAQ